jgi:general secretion pathway protein G
MSKNKLPWQQVLLKQTASSQGFSLIEILIALTLLGIAGTFVAGKIFDQLYEGQVQSTKIQMQSLAERLKEFRRHCGTYPTTDQGLESLIAKPSGGRDCPRYNPNGYIEGGKVPQDPWDENFVYESDGRTFNIYSYGADRQEGGEGQDKDIFLNEEGTSSGGGSTESETEAPQE